MRVVEGPGNVSPIGKASFSPQAKSFGLDGYAASGRIVFSRSSTSMTVIVAKNNFFYEEWDNSAREEVIAPRAFKQLMLVEKTPEAAAVKTVSTVMRQEKVQEAQSVAKEVAFEVDVKRNTVLLQPVKSSKSNTDSNKGNHSKHQHHVESAERNFVEAKSDKTSHSSKSNWRAGAALNGQSAHNKKVKEEKRIEAAIERHERHVAKDETLAERNS